MASIHVNQPLGHGFTQGIGLSFGFRDNALLKILVIHASPCIPVSVAWLVELRERIEI